jgi:hypothetical protein
MSQVAKSASAFVRAFLAILVLELEDMVVRLFRPPKLAGVRGDRWTVRLGISIDIRCPPWRLAWRAGDAPTPRTPSPSHPAWPPSWRGDSCGSAAIGQPFGLEGAVQVPHLASVLHVGDLGIDRLHRALGSAVCQLNRSGLDSPAAQLLMSRKSAALEDLMKRGRSNVS